MIEKHGMIISLQKELACIILGNTAGGRTENDIFLLGAPRHCEAFVSVGVHALTEIKKPCALRRNTVINVTLTVNSAQATLRHTESFT